jgi:hypothetical protein
MPYKRFSRTAYTFWVIPFLEKATFSTGTDVIETYNGAPHVGVFGGGTIVHTGANYAGGMAPAWIYQIVTPPTYSVQLVGPIQQGMNVPRADNMALDASGTSEVEPELQRDR